jgi:hypothetical protein
MLMESEPHGLKMNPINGHHKSLIRSLFNLAFPLLVLVQFVLFAPRLKSNIVYNSSVSKLYSFKQVDNSFADSKLILENWNFPSNVLAIKHATRKSYPKPPSNQRFYYEKRKGTADKGHEPFILSFEGIFLGYPFTDKSFVHLCHFIILLLWTGNSAKIRPPPAM